MNDAISSKTSNVFLSGLCKEMSFLIQPNLDKTSLQAKKSAS